mmetsp:Transcript_16420/g.24563  ORF Transcript_16420/g.24563 Transcript_16420/m.24563 type:complete len:229 (-) Transcript_16420:859-1545(-)
MNFNGVCLFHHYFHPFFIFFSILFCPPLNHVAFKVKLSTLIIETMSHFMPYNCTNGTEIDSGVCTGIEHGCLKNGSREYNLIETRVVVCVDRLRSHEPLLFICRGIHFLDLSHQIEITRLEHHGQERLILFNHIRRVVNPFIWIPDLNVETTHFLQRFLSCRIRFHPIDLLKPFFQSLSDTFNNCQCLLFAALIKIFAAVNLSKGLTKGRLGEIHGTFPARLDLCGSR